MSYSYSNNKDREIMNLKSKISSLERDIFSLERFKKYVTSKAPNLVAEYEEIEEERRKKENEEMKECCSTFCIYFFIILFGIIVWFNKLGKNPY